MAKKPADYDKCPGCKKLARLSDRPEGRIEFYDPICEKCRARAVRESEMDSFDHAYERAIANGWSD